MRLDLLCFVLLSSLLTYIKSCSLTLTSALQECSKPMSNISKSTASPYSALMLVGALRLNAECGLIEFTQMIDLSEEPVDWNIQTTAKYLKRMAPMKQWLEMEIGITGGEEDGKTSPFAILQC